MHRSKYWLAIIANIVIIVYSIVETKTDLLRFVSVVQLILNTLYFIKGNKKFISVGLAFFVLLFLFHCSRFVFFEDHGFDEFPETIVVISYKLVICCLSSLCAGYFMIRSRHRDYDMSDSTTELSDNDLHVLRRLSVAILLFSFIPFFYIDITRLQHTYTSGYSGMYAIGETDLLFRYFDPISHLFRPAVILLMVSYSKTPQKAKRVLVLFCVYSLLSMLSGARMTAMVYMLSTIVVFIRFILKRTSIIQIAIITAAAYFIFSILPVLSSMRTTGISSDEFRNASSVVEENGGGFNAAIDEYGGSQVSVIYAIAFTHRFNYGMTYLSSLLCVSPKLPSSLDKTNLAFTRSFPESYQSSLGGSCIGEAYYNFGFLSVLFFLIVGLLIGRLDYELCQITREKLLQGVFCLVLIPGLLTWVRDFFMILVFTSFWIPVIFSIFTKKRKNNRIML